MGRIWDESIEGCPSLCAGRIEVFDCDVGEEQVSNGHRSRQDLGVHPDARRAWIRRGNLQSSCRVLLTVVSSKVSFPDLWERMKPWLLKRGSLKAVRRTYKAKRKAKKMKKKTAATHKHSAAFV
jgi:hypothetical protein